MTKGILYMPIHVVLCFRIALTLDNTNKSGF